MWKHDSVKLLIKENNNQDPIKIVKSLARNLVLDAFSQGWKGPPFSPIELARILQLEIMPNEDIYDARLLPKKGKPKIEYNPNQRLTRINFSVAHEIGHILFSDCNLTIRNREKKLESNFDELEYLCDIIASEILLPYAEFTNEANSVPLNLESLLHISDKYQASLTSVFLRFCEVVNKSCAVLISTLDEKSVLTINYYKNSNLSSLKIPSDYVIPKNSSVYECVNPGWTSHKKEEWEIMDGKLYHVYSIGLAPIRNSNKKRIGVFLVPEYYNDNPKDQIYTVYGDATEPRGDGIKIIGQVVNTYAGLGSGFGKAMKKKWPITQKVLLNWKKDKDTFELGNSRLIELEEGLFVFQMIAQKGLYATEKNPIPLRYRALRKCLIELAVLSKSLNASVHLPLIGAGQAGGSWEIIEGMMYNELILNNVPTTIYILPGSKFAVARRSSLTRFNEMSIYES